MVKTKTKAHDYPPELVAEVQALIDGTELQPDDTAVNIAWQAIKEILCRENIPYTVRKARPEESVVHLKDRGGAIQSLPRSSGLGVAKQVDRYLGFRAASLCAGSGGNLGSELEVDPALSEHASPYQQP